MRAIRHAAARLAYDYAVEAENLRCTDPITAAAFRREASSIVDDLGLEIAEKTKRSDPSMWVAELRQPSISGQNLCQSADPRSISGIDGRSKGCSDYVHDRELRHLLDLMSVMHHNLNQSASGVSRMRRHWPVVLAFVLFISAGVGTLAVRSGFWVQIKPQVEAVIVRIIHTLK